MKRFKIDFTKVFDNLFSERELQVLNCFSEHDVDLDTLKTLGDVTDMVEEDNGVTKRTITFKSFDGSQSFMKTYSYNKADLYAEKIRRINEAIAEAVKDENYELAASLKQEKTFLLEQTLD